MKKIAFFDIDGTLTSEVDGSVPESAITVQSDLTVISAVAVPIYTVTEKMFFISLRLMLP